VKPACLILHYRQKYQSKILIEGSGSKAEKRKFQDVWKSETLWLIIYDYSRDVMSCDVFQKAGPDIAGKTQINTGTYSYYITPICIYFFGNNKGNFIINLISFFSD
jgi:hypothetical protein